MSRLVSAISKLPAGQQLLDVLGQRLAAAGNEAEREERILNALLPPAESVSEVALTQLRWNAVARDEALREFGAFTSAQLAELRRAQTTNPHATTSRWLSAGRLFALDAPSGRLFPAFQFADGQPRPVIAAVLKQLGSRLGDWELLLWFTGSSGYLDGRRPVDLLDVDPDGVVDAAAYQASVAED
ncbi:MAG: hypothetical protein ACRDGD_03130 [Candidatus Limnocylindria bacterium]